MDGIMTGEQVWIARGQHGTERMSIPRALREAELEARRRHEGPAMGPEEPGAEPSRSNRSRIRRFAAWWIRGWMAFAASAGQPYLSLSGRTVSTREASESADAASESSPAAERGEGLRAETAETGARPSTKPANILEEAPAVG